MTHGHGGPTMDQKIFRQDLTTEAVSLYLLLCGLADEDKKLTTGTVLTVWNGSREAFDKALADLEAKNIVERFLTDGEGQDVYKVAAAAHWK